MHHINNSKVSNWRIGNEKVADAQERLAKFDVMVIRDLNLRKAHESLKYPLTP